MSQPPSNADPASSAPLSRHHEDHPEMIERNSRYGLILFVVYLALFGGFIGLSAFSPAAMSKPVFAGVNLAIVYGMGLIFAALGLAAVYMWWCRPIHEEPVVFVPSADAVPDVTNDQGDTR